MSWAFHILRQETYKVLEKLDISTELRYYLERSLNARPHNGPLPTDAKAILSA